MPAANRTASHDSATVERILKSAAHEFARHGYSATRIRDIVDAAEANLASVNYHFGGKEGLYRATLERFAKNMQWETPGDAPEKRALSPEEQLHAFTRVMLVGYLGSEDSAPMSRVIAHELLDPTPAFAAMLETISGPQWARLSEIVSMLLGPAASEEDRALAMLSVVGQWAFFLFGRRMFERQFPEIAEGAAVIDQLAGHISAFSLAGIRAMRIELESPAGNPAKPSAPAQMAGERNLAKEKAVRRRVPGRLVSKK